MTDTTSEFLAPRSQPTTQDEPSAPTVSTERTLRTQCSARWRRSAQRLSLSAIVSLLLLAAGCGDGDSVTDLADAVENDELPSPCESTEPRVVSVPTQDGLELEADYYPAGAQGAGAVVLLHMTPPNDRTNYPPRVLEALQGAGVNVLNLDRRGAGERSPDDPPQGVNGVFDVEAAVAFLLDGDASCPADPGRIALVGASNGTTSVLDYTVDRAEAGLPDPVALIWLSPGTYTEQQNTIGDHRNALEALPILWIYPAAEPYSVDFIDDAATDWRFVELADGAHGTLNFDDGDLEARVLSEMLAWIEQWLVGS